MAAALREKEIPLISLLGLLVRERLVRLGTRLLHAADRVIGSNNYLRLFGILLVYSVELALVFYIAYEMRWDFSIPSEFIKQRNDLIITVVLCKLLLLHSFGQFKSILSYFGLADFGAVLLSMTTVSGLMLCLWYGSDVSAAPPRGVILMDFVLSIALISAFRLTLRVIRSWTISSAPLGPATVGRRIAIVGAGDVGEVLAKDLLQRRSGGFQPVMFIDDDPKKIGRSVHGLPVYGPIEKLVDLAPRLRVNELVITLANVTPKRVKEIVEVGRKIGASAQIIPSFTQLASGQVKVERSRPVVIEDLLGRAAVNLKSTGVSDMIGGRVIMVTGAGGSIGSELCRQILAQKPKALVMVEQAEIALFEIEQELIGAGYAALILPMIADVVDENAVRSVFDRTQPEIVFHAAAHKHVPLMERQPSEAIKNNTLATACLTRIASEYQVSHFVFISTDKAINPTSVMGCSKRLAEKALLARQRAPGNQTRFLAVRFGNVLGSSGSVIPTFRRQIAQGGPVTVTHQEMTRYFMTIPEAVGLVLQTATLGQGGEIFILDMGQPVKIIEMARQMIELSGYKPDVDIEIKITGLRPGEKLFEELRHTEETHETTDHPRIFKLRTERPPEDIEEWFRDLRHAVASGEPTALKQAMKRLVPEYTPFADSALEPAAAPALMTPAHSSARDERVQGVGVLPAKAV